MPGLTVEDAKSDMQAELEKRKEALEKEKLSHLAPEERKAAELKKQEEVKKAQEEQAKAEEQKKADEAILSKKPEELSEDEKKRAETLNEEKRKAEEAKLSAEEKLKRTQEKTQKRIDEALNELKQVKDIASKEAQALRDEITALKKNNDELSKKLETSLPVKDALQAQISKAERERIDQYLAEDKHLPRHQRREMSKDELEEWMLEDLVSAQEWLVDRRARRDSEKADDLRKMQSKQQADSLIKKQMESLNRVLSKHKELDDKASDKSKLFASIINENKEDFMLAENGPELVAAEMEKRLVKEPSESDKRIDELTHQIEQLTAKIQSLENDDAGINSTVPRSKESKEKYTKEEQALADTMREVGASEDMIKSAIAKRKGMRK